MKIKQRKKSTNKSHLCGGGWGRKDEGSSRVLRGRRAASSPRPRREPFTGTSELTHRVAPSFLGLPSALPKRSERSTEEEWVWVMSWMRGMKAGRDMWTKGGAVVSFGGLEGEGELGPGLALAEDDFLLLLLLLLTVLLQLHALLVNLSLLLYNTQLLLSLEDTETTRSDKDRKPYPSS